LEFQQSAWLAKYINLNTEMRKKACNEFERDFFKLLNNAVFGKYLNDISLSLSHYQIDPTFLTVKTYLNSKFDYKMVVQLLYIPQYIST